MPRVFTSLLVALSLLCSIAPALGAWQDDIGYTQLQAELGIDTPTGAGITVSMAEPVPGNYGPNPSNAQFVGKTINFMSGITGSSGHATSVAQYFVGNTSSIAAGVNVLDSWEANDWIGAGFLRALTTLEPLVELRDVQNHSWIGNPDPLVTTDIIRRFDYTIQRDDYVAVVGMNNGVSTSVPGLLGHNYNGISVGRSDGSHSAGFTTIDGPGRVKPDIVAPINLTSYATPVVGSAAALLLETAASDSLYANASKSITIKAILMAGATKDKFPDWDRTYTRPLDEKYGAGELNIYRSYNTLVAGEQNASSSSLVGLTAWDYGATTGDDLLWFFEVDSGMVMDELSAVLTWNRVIENGLSGASWGNPSASLANLDLELWSADGFGVVTKLDHSASTVDNVEHIYYQNLSAGRYAFLMPSAGAGTDFALAWHSVVSPIPEPSAILLLLVAMTTAMSLRIRRRARQ